MSITGIDHDVRALARSHVAMFAPEAPTDLRAILEGLAIELIDRPFWDSPDFTGVAVIDELEEFRLIIVNSLLPRPRWSFTVAHEIGHLVMHHRLANIPALERLANVYASELLMPRGRTIAQIRRYGSDVRRLAVLNGVSFSAMRRRLEELWEEETDGRDAGA